jgi:hypothetical protein
MTTYLSRLVVGVAELLCWWKRARIESRPSQIRFVVRARTLLLIIQLGQIISFYAARPCRRPVILLGTGGLVSYMIVVRLYNM